jgi:uncharacterized protein (TIGR02246 family)
MLMKKIQLGMLVAAMLFLIPVNSRSQSLPGKQRQASALQSANEIKGKGSLEEAILSMERRAWEAVKARDARAFTDLFAADGLMADSMGFSTRDGFLQTLPDLMIDQYMLNDVKVMMIDKNAALITYKADVKGSFKGKAFPANPMFVSSIWAKRDGKWMAVYHQETIAQ